MSNLFKYTKRVLTSVLAAAVVLTAIPSTAFGAEVIEDDAAFEVVEAQEEAVAEVGEEAETTDGTSGDEEEVIIEEGDDPDQTYNDTDLFVTMGDDAAALPANTNAVVLAGDTSALFGSAVTQLDVDDTGVVDPDSSDKYGRAGKIDSALGTEVYIVPDYGYSLASDLEIKVMAKYTKNAVPKAIEATDWSVEDVDLSQLDGLYDWGKAKKVTIKPGTFLTGYAGADSIDDYLAIIVNNKPATRNTVPFTVTVDGKAKATGYKFNATANHGNANDLVASVKTTDVSDGLTAHFDDETYDVSVSINDASGKKLVEYKRNGTAKDDDTEDGAKMKDGTTTKSDYAFFLATETAAVNLYISDQGVKTAYEYSKKKTGTLTVAFTKKSTIPTTEFTVSSNDSSYATLKNGVALGEGTEIKTTGSTVKVDTDKDFFFNVKAKGDQNIEKVEYYISGMTGKKEVKKLDKGRAVFVGAADSELYSKITSPTGDPSTSSYYEFDATEVEYVASTDTEVKDGKTYYSKAGSATTPEATEGLYGIPFTTDHGATAETVKGDITLYVTTSADVVYDVETYAGTGSATHTYVDIASKDANDADFIITGGVTDVHTAGSLESTALIGKPYTFTVAPIEHRKIKSVTAKMIPNATGTTAQSVELEKGNYGQYTIAEVKGKVTITVRTETDDIDKNTVKKVADTSAAAATAVTKYTIKEKTTGTEVTDSGVNIAVTDAAFDFVVSPDSTYGIEKVEYEMGGAAKATLTPVAEKANGEKEYHIAKVTGEINITVTTGASANAVDVTKQKNKDAKLTFNNEVIKDDAKVRALKNSDLTFKVEPQNGAEILGVWYYTSALTSGDYTVATNTMSSGTKIESTSGTYTISSGALTADLYICVVTKRNEVATAYTAKMAATVGKQATVADATAITMRAGGKAISDATCDPDPVNAKAVLTASFFDKDGLNISDPAKTVYTVEKKTAKTALVVCNATTGAITPSGVLTTNVAGAGSATDTITATLTTGTFPQFVGYTKSIGLTVEPLSTYYEKVELAQATASPTTTYRASIASDPGDTIRVDSANGADAALYSLIPYQIVKGESKKLDALVDNDVDGTTGYIGSVSWTSDPEVPATVKPDAMPFVFNGPSNEAVATISGAAESGIGTVNVEATLNFVDGSKLKTNKGTTKIVEESCGYVAIPTVTVNGSTIFNPDEINLETNGSIKTANIKWDVYEFATATGFDTHKTDIFTFTTQKDLDAIVDGYDIKKVDSSTVNFKLEADKANADKVTITSGALSSVTAAKKGTATLDLKATKNGMPVHAQSLTANIAYNMPTVKVRVTTGGIAALAKFNTGYQNPAYTATASVKKINGVTVSEDVDANKKTIGHYLMNVPVGTVIQLPDQTSAFEATTVDPKWKLYGWNVVDGGYDNYHKIGDNVVITATTTQINPLWAPKYGTDGLNGAIQVVRYDNEIATALTANAHALTLAVGTEDEPILVPIAVRYKTLDVAKGPDASGDPQYVATWTYDRSAKLVLEATGVSTTNNNISTVATIIGSVPVSVKYTDADGVVYSDYDATNKDDLVTKTINVTSQAKTDVSLKVVASASDVIKAKTGQTVTVPVNEFKIGGVAKNFDDSLVASVKASTASSTVATAVVDTAAGTKNVIVTGKGVGDTTLTVTATLTDGTTATATAALKVEASDVEIVATVNGEVMGNTLYFQVNKADNSLVWDLKKGGEIVTGTTATDWDFQYERLGVAEGTTLPEGDVEWKMVPDSEADGIVEVADTKSATVDTTSNGKLLGIGQLTVTFSDAANGTYKKTYPVVTYQAVTVIAPASDTEAGEFAIKKNGTPLAKGKNSVEKLTYVKGQAKYSFSTSAYTAEWLDTEHPKDPYWWESATTYSPVESSKVADFGDEFTFSKAELEGLSGGVTLGAAFGSPMITISNIPDSITLSDETLSTATALGTDVAVIRMGVTPYNSYSTNPIAVGGDNYDMYMLGIGNRSSTSGATAVSLANTYSGATLATTPTWDPAGVGSLGKSKLNNGGGDDGDPDTLDKAVIATASVTTGKNRTDTFTVGKVNDPKAQKQYVGKSKINVVADGKVYKTIDLYINGEYNTGVKDSDGNDIYHYMLNGSDLVNGVATVQGAKHYYKDSARVDGGVIDVEGGKILINGGAQVTTVGKAAYDGKYYYVGTDGFLVTGKQFNGLVTAGALADNTKKYLADADGVLTQSTLVGKNYYDDNCQMAVASASAKDYEPTSDGKYYVNTAGEVAINGIFKVADKDRLFRTDGTIVKHTDADVKDGKCVVDGVTYLIAEDDTAKRDDVWYAPSVKWSSWPSKWSKTEAIPTMTYQVTFTSLNDGKQHTTDGIIAAVEPLSVAATATEVKFTATADLSAYFTDKTGTKKAENVITQRQYTFKNGGESGQSGQEVDPSGDILIVGLEDTYPWTGKQIKPAFKVVDANGNYLAQGVDFTVKYGKNKDAGQGTVTITGKGNYSKAGTAATFTIVKEAAPEDPAGQVSGFGKIAQQTYTGSPIYPDEIVVKLKNADPVTMEHKGDGVYGNKLIGGKELLVVVTNNVNKGSATVAATGSNGVTKTTTFKINAKSMEGANATGSLGNPFEVTISDSADYKIKNTTPEVSIKFNGDELVEGQDFTAKFDAKKGKVTVTGKNNFTKKFVQEGITVNPLNLSDCKLVAVTAYEGVKTTGVKATVLDPDGNLVPAGKYTLTVTPDDDAVGSNGKLIGGKEIKVQAKANGKDSLITGETSEEDFTVAKNFGKASIKVTGSVVYTGEAIELDDDWVNTNVTVKYSGSVIKCGDDFEIVGYTNNVKKGTMTVYCAGKGDFSGTKNFKVKITPKPFGTK